MNQIPANDYCFKIFILITVMKYLLKWEGRKMYASLLKNTREEKDLQFATRMEKQFVEGNIN